MLNRRRITTFIAISGLAAVVACSGCFAYRFGAQSLYRPDVRTVYVPVVPSDSYRRYLGERLTEAITKEIETTTPYKVVSDPNADSILRCRLTNDTKRVVVETRTDEPRVAEIAMYVTVEWVDRRGQPLNQNTQIPLPVTLGVSAASDFIAEGGQSVTTAQQQDIIRMAQQIVSQMQVWW